MDKRKENFVSDCQLDSFDFFFCDSATSQRNTIMSADSIADKNIAVWKVKKLIKSLEMARGYSFLKSKWLTLPPATERV